VAVDGRTTPLCTHLRRGVTTTVCRYTTCTMLIGERGGERRCTLNERKYSESKKGCERELRRSREREREFRRSREREGERESYPVMNREGRE
jgi:hypothetical protein